MNKKSKNEKTEVYDLHTFNSENLLARFAHHSRYKLGLKLINVNKNVLDFGCGDGRFLNELFEKKNIGELIGYEPYMESDIFKNISIFKEWPEILAKSKKLGGFDNVVCFEVLEHLNIKNQIKLLNRVHKVIKENGVFIISVPIEKGLPALVKNLRRIIIHYDPNVYNFKNIFASILGKKTKWMKEHRKEEIYLSHSGFFFDELEQVLSQTFSIEERKFSPFNGFGYNLNSQVFYILRKKSRPRRGRD